MIWIIRWSLSAPHKERKVLDLPEFVEKVAVSALRQIAWFKTLDERILDRIALEARRTSFSDGDRIWNAGDDATHFSFVEFGLVQIVKTNLRGDDATLGIFGPGEGVGNLAAMEGTPYPAAALAASEDVTLLRISAAALTPMMQANTPLMTGANRSLIAHSKKLLSKIDVLCAGPVPARLAVLFLQLADRFGQPAEDTGAFIPIALSRGALGRLVSAREETVIRVLTEWKDLGWVTTSPTGFHIRAVSQLESITSGE